MFARLSSLLRVHDDSFFLIFPSSIVLYFTLATLDSTEGNYYSKINKMIKSLLRVGGEYTRIVSRATAACRRRTRSSPKPCSQLRLKPAVCELLSRLCVCVCVRVFSRLLRASLAWKLDGFGVSPPLRILRTFDVASAGPRTMR
ncbi:hypothetical protein LZ31DRAFT_46819 [Colletotrichum somersetense]|nr:hypothetical protein LZ31DRAFT_46819 [Colletotrichum somersetense]